MKKFNLFLLFLFSIALIAACDDSPKKQKPVESSDQDTYQSENDSSTTLDTNNAKVENETHDVDVSTAECISGTFQCSDDGKSIAYCKEGTSGAAKQCNTTCECTDKECYCEDGEYADGTCFNGFEKCEDESVLYCKEGAWETNECKNGCSCNGGECVCIPGTDSEQVDEDNVDEGCVSGEYTCVDDKKIAYCKEGTPIDPEVCNTSCKCDKDYGCFCEDGTYDDGTCFEGFSKCEEDKVTFCKEGSWATVECDTSCECITTGNCNCMD